MYGMTHLSSGSVNRASVTKCLVSFPDTRYLGCYHDNSSDPDLPELMWDKDEEKSAAQCVDECSKQNYRYAGVQDGGACYCGNAYGRHDGAPERDCSVLCETTGAHQNCGGVETNAIYRTEIRKFPLRP